MADGTERPSKWIPTTDLLDLAVLGKLAEECGELSSIIARCIIQGPDENDPESNKPNLQALMEEIADVRAMSELAIARFQLDRGKIAARTDRKIQMKMAWHSMIMEDQEDDEPSNGTKLYPAFQARESLMCPIVFMEPIEEQTMSINVIGFTEPPTFVPTEDSRVQTQAQMAAAPNMAFYLTPNAQATAEYRKIAQFIRRRDLRIYDIDFALEDNARVVNGSRCAIVVDHACWSFDRPPNEEQMILLRNFRKEGRLI